MHMKISTALGVRTHGAGGFTLVELAIVLVIISVLAVIAYPSYRNYTIKSNRSAAEAFMMDVANRERQYLLDARQYLTTSSDYDLTNNLQIVVPPAVTRFYQVSVSTGTAPPSFLVTA